MTFIITQSCCNDTSCVEVCPVDCIHPSPNDPGFSSAEMLYVNPDDCIDCGACVDVCPVSAIYPDYDLPAEYSDYLLVNAQFFDYVGDVYDSGVRHRSVERIDREGPLRVAVVGAGPAGWFVADELIKSRRTEVEVTLIDRLATPNGLVRYGVAPDHLSTKDAASMFAKVGNHRLTTVRLGLEVGGALTHADLLDTHHAVVYATGTPQGRKLGLPGEDLPGSASAADFVGWYNGHPDHTAHDFDLSHERVVIIGNGNVALDMARVLLLPEKRLHSSEIVPHALATLATSGVEEVVLVGRRGAAHAAFTSPEFRALLSDPDIDLVVDPADAAELQEAADTTDDLGPAGFALKEKAALLTKAAGRARTGGKGLVLRFNFPPAEIVGEGRVTGLRSVDGETIEAGLVLRATGYLTEGVTGVAVAGTAGRFHHDAGRVLDPATDQPVLGTYTAGWAKRGPSGVIGTNRSCAAETVASLLDDYAAGRLADPSGGAAELDAVIVKRGLPLIDIKGWKALDTFELDAGAAAGRPRIKVVDAAEQLRISQAG